MKNVSQKVITDIVKGLNPVTGAPIHFRQRSLQSDIMSALLRSNSGESQDGQLSRLVDDLYFFTTDISESHESKALNVVIRRAVCDDYISGINAHDLAEDYQIPLTKVLAYLIDEGLLSTEQSVFFTRALQHNEPRHDSRHGTNVVRIRSDKNTVNNPLSSALI